MQINITLQLDLDMTRVVIHEMPGHGGVYEADSYRVRSVQKRGAEARWAEVNDGYEDAQADHAEFMALLTAHYGEAVAATISTLMAADMMPTEQDDRDWGRA